MRILSPMPLVEVEVDSIRQKAGTATGSGEEMDSSDVRAASANSAGCLDVLIGLAFGTLHSR
jgi:hypothetical protein